MKLDTGEYGLTPC